MPGEQCRKMPGEQCRIQTVSPLMHFNSGPSSLDIVTLTIQFGRDDIEAAQYGDNVAQLMIFDQLWENRKMHV